MTKKRIQEYKNISNRRGMFTEGVICDCLDECIDEIERLQAEVERLNAAFVPTIELLESVRSNSAISDEVWIALAEPVKQELARLRAIVEGGKPLVCIWSQTEAGLLIEIKALQAVVERLNSLVAHINFK